MEAAQIQDEIDGQIESLRQALFRPRLIFISLALYKVVARRILRDRRTRISVGSLPTHYRGCEFVLFERSGMLRVAPDPAEAQHRAAALEEWEIAVLPPAQLAPRSRRLQARILNRELRNTIAELAGGEFPVNMASWRRVGRRLGVGIELVPGERAPSVNVTLGVLILPTPLPWITQQAYLLHELGELAMRTECRQEYRYPESLGSHHDIARRAETEYVNDHGFRRVPGGGFRPR